MTGRAWAVVAFLALVPAVIVLGVAYVREVLRPH